MLRKDIGKSKNQLMITILESSSSKHIQAFTKRDRAQVQSRFSGFVSTSQRSG